MVELYLSSPAHGMESCKRNIEVESSFKIHSLSILVARIDGPTAAGLVATAGNMWWGCNLFWTGCCRTCFQLGRYRRGVRGESNGLDGHEDCGRNSHRPGSFLKYSMRVSSRVFIFATELRQISASMESGPAGLAAS